MNKDLMKAMGFEEEMKLVEKGRCPFCKKKVNISNFDDIQSKNEFFISGLCKQCQDKMFT